MKFIYCLSIGLLFIARVQAQSLIQQEAPLVQTLYPSIEERVSDYRIVQLRAEEIHAACRQIGGVIQMECTLGDLHWSTQLIYDPLLAEDYVTRVGSDDGIHLIELPEVLTYSPYSGEKATMTSIGKYLYAHFWHEDEEYILEPARHYATDAPDDQFILYNVNNFKNIEGASCSVSQERELEETISTQQFSIVDQCKEIEIALANDSDMIGGYTDAAGVAAHGIAVLNTVRDNYRMAFLDNCEYVLVTQYISTSDAMDPTSNSTNSDILLPEFRSWGNGGGFGAGISYDVASMWHYRDYNGSTIGLAYVDVICESSRYNINQALNLSNRIQAVVQSHEIGHNWGAVHVSQDGFIMTPSVNLTNQWAPSTQTIISNTLASAPCLSSCVSPPVAVFRPNPIAVCAGSTFEIRDKSINGASRNWSFPGGSPSSSTDARPLISYASPGSYSVSLTSTNTQGSDSRTDVNAIQVTDAPVAASCTVDGTDDAAGILRFTLADFSNSSSADGIYEDFSCGELIPLMPSTSYSFSATLFCQDGAPSGAGVIRIYIDYNNDGVFGAGEEVYSDGGSAACPTKSGTIATTPASPIMDTPLRLRVNTALEFLSDPCDQTLTSGQSEDYAVIFSSVLPVELISFSASRLNDEIVIDWATAQERHNDYFILQRSIDGKEWTDIHRIPGAGWSDRIKKYRYTDTQPLKGNNYYRLIQVDYDGTRTYSDIERVDMDISSATPSIYPNPTYSELYLTGTQPGDEIQLYDLSGRLLGRAFGQEDITTLRLESLLGHPGLYLVRHTRSGETIQTGRISYLGQ